MKECRSFATPRARACGNAVPRSAPRSGEPTKGNAARPMAEAALIARRFAEARPMPDPEVLELSGDRKCHGVVAIEQGARDVVHRRHPETTAFGAKDRESLGVEVSVASQPDQEERYVRGCGLPPRGQCTSVQGPEPLPRKQRRTWRPAAEAHDPDSRIAPMRQYPAETDGWHPKDL